MVAPAPETSGTFCWIDLATTDPTSARMFYPPLFGWETKATPMPDGADYTLCLVEGMETAAFYQLKPSRKSKSRPPWLPYIAVASADRTTAKAKTLGGEALMEPFDVMTVGRMALLSDPTGAVFALWEARTPRKMSPRQHGVPHCFLLATDDTEKASGFYGSLLGWKTKPSAQFPTYTEFYGPRSESIGGMVPLSKDKEKAEPHWLVYFEVSNCDESANKAKALGGQWLVPPKEIPNLGRFSSLQDPEGAVFAIFQPARK